jgi:phosphoribosylanthranilate isomerase
VSAPAPARPRVKVCGLTRAEDALAALDAGADYLGFIFAPESPRRLDPAAAASLVRALPRGRAVDLVGVFVNERPERVNAIAAQVGLTMVQLHGEETPADCAAIALPAIKVLRLARAAGEPLEAAVERALAAAARYSTPFLMIEPYVEGRRGGTGRTADWQLAAAVVARLAGRRIFLAGGLSPSNVAQAVAAVRPFAVDASSGLEAGAGAPAAGSPGAVGSRGAPGIKDPQLIRSYVEAARRL